MLLNNKAYKEIKIKNTFDKIYIIVINYFHKMNKKNKRKTQLVS